MCTVESVFGQMKQFIKRKKLKRIILQRLAILC